MEIIENVNVTINTNQPSLKSSVSVPDVNVKAKIQTPTVEYENDYDKLENIPTINGVEVKGNKTIENFEVHTSELINDGDGQSPFATENYVEQNGGKIDKILINDNEQQIVNKTVNLQITKTTVGLSNVDNTSDLDKPISNATQTELNSINDELDNINRDLENEIERATLAETEISTKLQQEMDTRVQEHAEIQGDINTINSKIPNQASSTNQLADKAFVNSTINSSAAFFKGNFATKAALDAVQWQTTDSSLETYVTNNDYAYVEADETHNNEAWRYIYVKDNAVSEWQPQFRVNETPFTQAQLDAINSGATEALINSISSKLTVEDIVDSTGDSSIKAISQRAATLGINTVQSNLNTHITNKNNPHQVTKTQIGLGNVNNTADLDKPISTAVQNEFNRLYPAINFAEMERQKSKNLFNTTKAEQVGYSWAGVPAYNSPNYISCGFIKIKPNTNYIFSYADSSITMRYTGALFYTADKTYIGYDECNQYTFKTPSNAEYMLCQFWFESNPMNYKDIIQIEEGTVATEFQSYNGPIQHNIDVFDLKTLRTLPYEYQEVEYIESTGTQYIDTGVVPNQNTGFEIDFKTNNAFGNSVYGCIFGARTQSVVNELQLSTFCEGTNTTGTLRRSTTSNKAGLISSRMTAKLIGNQYSNSTGYSLEIDSTDFTAPSSITIFALNQSGSKTQYGKTILYSFKLYDGLTLVRDFIPCYRKSDGEIGLYDLVNNRFYSNQGSGTLLKGENVYLSNVARRNDAAVVFAESEYKKSKNLLQNTLNGFTLQADKDLSLVIYNKEREVTYPLCFYVQGNIDYPLSPSGALFKFTYSDDSVSYLTGTGFRPDIQNYMSTVFDGTKDLKTITVLNWSDNVGTIEFAQLEENDHFTGYQPYNGPVLHKIDLANLNVLNKVSFTKYAGISVAGTTKDVYKYDPTTIYAPNGLIMGGTAQAAGLVTRGICGVNTPNEAGYCTKDNLYINYDGTDTYSNTRQLVLQAGSVGTHYGNNLYQYAAARGDAVKNYCDANYLSLNNGGKLKGKLSFNGDNAIQPQSTLGYIVGLQTFSAGGNLIYASASNFIKQLSSSVKVGGLNYFKTGFVKSAGSASGITTSISNNILTVTSEEGNGNYVSIDIDQDIEANMTEGDEFIFSMDIRATTDTSIAVSGKPTVYFKSGMGYYAMDGEVERLSSGQYTTLTYIGNWKKTNSIALHLGFASAIGKFYITNLRFEKGTINSDIARNISANTTSLITSKQLEINHNTAPAVLLNAANAGNDIRVEFKCESSGTNSFIGIGSGGTNNGYFSRTLDKWLWYADASKWYLNQPTIKGATINTSSVPSGQTLTVAGVLNASSAGGLNYSGIETGGSSSNDMLRCVWFSHSSEKGRPIIAEDFKYNPYSRLLKVNGTVECSTINLLV